MTPVTDPNLLAELNGSPGQGGNLKPVTDPSILSELNGGNKSQGLIQQLANSPLVQGALGAGDAVRNFGADVYNMLPGNIPIQGKLAGALGQHNIPMATNGSGLPYTIGNMAGNTATFMGAGAGMDALRGAAEALPYGAGKVAQLLGGNGWAAGTARRGLGSAAYGAVTNPDDRGTGAAEGAGFSALADAIPAIGGLLAKGSSLIRPQKYAEQLMDKISGGKGLEESGKLLAQEVKKTYEQKVEEGKALYDPIFSKAGEDKIYGEGLGSSYGSLDKEIFGGYDRNIKKLHDNFIKNPTLQNAHDLQSQIGTSIRENSKGNLSIADRNTVQGYKQAQDSIRQDIGNFLNTKNPDLANQYNGATKNWLNNVVPYIENSKISQMAKGDIENPRNISNIFRNPEADTQKIIEDMGPEAARKILYSEIGRHGSNLKPEELLSSFNDLEKKGLGSYITPDMARSMVTLDNRIKGRTAAQTGMGMLAGGLIGHHFGGAIPLAETAGTMAGGALGYGAKKVSNLMPNSSSLIDAIKSAYRPISKGILANTIPGDQQ